MPGKNSVPLEKLLLPMDLTRGLDERTRPEVGGDQSKVITTLDNLIQEQAGCWVKRPGLIGGTTNLSSAAILRLIRTQNGLAGIATDARLYHANVGNSNIYTSKGYIPEFKLHGRMVGSVNTNTTNRVLSCASNDDYDAVVTEGSYATGGNRTCNLIVTERTTGQQIAFIDLVTAMIAGSGSFTPQAKIVFVANGDLHIWLWQGNTLGSPLSFGVWSSSSVSTISSVTSIDALNQVPLTDINAYQTGGTIGSVVTYGANARTMTTSLVTTVRGGGHTYHSVEVAGDFYLLSSDSATGRARLDRVALSNINGAAISSFVDASLTFPANTTPGVAFDAVGGELFISYEDTSTFPRVQTYSCVMGGAFNLRSSIYGWRLLSTPFRGGLSNRVYAHLCKDETGLATQNPVGCHVVVNLSEYFSTNHSITTNLTNILPVAACLDPYLGVRNTQRCTYAPGHLFASTTWPRQRYFQQSSIFPGQFNITMPVQVTNRTVGFMSITLTDDATDNYSSNGFGQTTVIAGGATTVYDGRKPIESGFFDYPMFTAVDSGVAGNPNGSYNYVCLFKKVDIYGNTHYSRVFGPVSVTVASKKVTITAQACHVTNSESASPGAAAVTLELYRTISGGTQYFLCSSSNTPASSPQELVKGAAFYSATDDMSDATLQTKSLLFRQPGTANTALDRYPGPGGFVSCQHKDRTFITDTIGSRIYYSSFLVDGEGPWFNTILSFQAQGGNGPVTGMASMDGRLLIFKRDAIFVVDGDGPPENGGNGTEFSPPARLATDYGCTDWRSIVLTDNGIMYRSVRGIELLTRSLQVKWLGERVQNTVDDHVHTKYAFQDDSGRVHIGIADNTIEDYYGGTGKEVVYDTTSDAWSTATLWSNAVYGGIPQSATVFDYKQAHYIPTVRKVAYAESNKLYQAAVDGTTADSDGYIPWTFETGWIRPAGLFARHRFHDALFLGKNRGDHKLRMSIASDYESTYSKSRIWDPTSIGDKPLEEFDIQPKNTQPFSFRLKVEDVAPAGWSFSGLNNSVDLLGICFVISPKAGAIQVAESKKG